jgi:hypothetical protein
MLELLAAHAARRLIVRLEPGLPRHLQDRRRPGAQKINGTRTISP